MYFDLKRIRSLEDIKLQYRYLAMQHHPDRGGSVEAMQEINAEYDRLFSRYKNIHYSFRTSETYEKETEETAEEFRDLIYELIRLNGIKIEVIGSFVWVSGETKQHKERLKALGMKWSRNKCMWYHSPVGYRRFGKHDYSYDEIKSMYRTHGIYYGQNDRRKEIEDRR